MYIEFNHFLLSKKYMCGICGYVSRQRITTEVLSVMNDTMYHRGPDDYGAVVFAEKDGYNVGLAHRRLSILDLSVNGHQPMCSVDGRLAVVFNGEVYNYPILREELSDYPYVSTCDTEIILAAYLKWGTEMATHIHGMFAIAIYDRDKDTLILIRDRIGKKPLYYTLSDSGIYFASELKPLMKCPNLDLSINPGVIPRFILHQYIAGPESIFNNVYKLEPGSILTFRQGEISKTKYWDISSVYAHNISNPVKDYAQAKSELKSILNHAVASRMIADVPIGTFLSGGYDSSLVTAIAQSLSSSPVKTFCIGFEDTTYNEAIYAKEVASYLGTDHTEVYIDERDMYEMVESIAKYYDEPFADSSQIPSMLVSKVAKQDVTVALSGDGGDEFFCGYTWYDKIRIAQYIDPLGAVAYKFGNISLGSKRILDTMPFRIRAIANNRYLETKTQVIPDGYTKAASLFLTEEIRNDEHILPLNYPVESEYNVKNWQIRRMLLDMDTYLPDDILVKMDRASMKYSLESRCPILDTDVMEYSFRIPHKYKYYKGDKKHILKDIAYDYIPKSMLDRPKKGFSVPLDKWLRGPLKESIMDYSNKEYLIKQGLFDPEYVSQFISNYLATGDAGPSSGNNFSKIVWPFYIFQQWYEHYLNEV